MTFAVPRMTILNTSTTLALRQWLIRVMTQSRQWLRWGCHQTFLLLPFLVREGGACGHLLRGLRTEEVEAGMVVGVGEGEGEDEKLPALH